MHVCITFPLQEMAVYKEVRALQLVPTELVKPIKSSLPTRLALSRLELLEELLEQLGTIDSGFTLDNVMRVKTSFTFIPIKHVISASPRACPKSLSITVLYSHMTFYLFIYSFIFCKPLQLLSLILL